MKKALLLSSFILISTVAFAFGGGAGMGSVAKYRHNKGIDVLGVRIGDASLTKPNIVFVECDKDPNAQYHGGLCVCNKGYERTLEKNLCHQIQCSVNHPELCKDLDSCEETKGFWCALTNKCLTNLSDCCAMDNLTACQTKTHCLMVDGSWVNDACQEPICDMDHLDLCLNATTCTTALGYWCGRRDECVAIEEDCICDAGYELNYTTQKCTECQEGYIRSKITPYDNNVSWCFKCVQGTKPNDSKTECIACEIGEDCYSN